MLGKKNNNKKTQKKPQWWLEFRLATVCSEKSQMTNKRQGNSEAKNLEQPTRLYIMGLIKTHFFLHHRFVWALFFNGSRGWFTQGRSCNDKIGHIFAWLCYILCEIATSCYWWEIENITVSLKMWTLLEVDSCCSGMFTCVVVKLVKPVCADETNCFCLLLVSSHFPEEWLNPMEWAVNPKTAAKIDSRNWVPVSIVATIFHTLRSSLFAFWRIYARLK